MLTEKCVAAAAAIITAIFFTCIETNAQPAPKDVPARTEIHAAVSAFLKELFKLG